MHKGKVAEQLGVPLLPHGALHLAPAGPIDRVQQPGMDRNGDPVLDQGDAAPLRCGTPGCQNQIHLLGDALLLQTVIKHVQLVGGVLPVEGQQQVVQEGRSVVEHQAQPQNGTAAAGQGVDLRFCLLHNAQDLLAPLIQDLSGRGEGEGGGAEEQRGVVVLLQLPQMLADGLLRYDVYPGGGSDAALIRNIQKIFQIQQVHTSASSVTEIIQGFAGKGNGIQVKGCGRQVILCL